MSHPLYISQAQHSARASNNGLELMKRIHTLADTATPLMANEDANHVNAVADGQIYGQTAVPVGKDNSRPRILARRIARSERRATR